ncbi:MAG TPA: hypothetical protein VLV54_16100 [Thermoanaerobaculia bacterium]|nr:hypothetical protein [Thermoanaerobaculia bacterium]
MRGFLTPLGKDTLNYYWMQGWPHALLLYLFVQKVEIKDGDQTKVLLNYPDSADLKATKLQDFGDWVQHFLAQEPDIEEVPVPVNIGPILPEEKLTNLSKLVEMSKEGLVLTPAGDKVYQLQKKQTDFRFKFGNQDKDVADVEPPPAASPRKALYLQALPQESAKIAISNDDSKTTTFFLRSPEAILYYLGELMRLANREASPMVPYVCIQDRLQPLFVARPAGACTSTLIDAETAQERFAIPKSDPEKLVPCNMPGSLQLKPPTCDTGRSMHGLSLLSQVISLQKSAKDNPGTALVRIVGN